MVITFTGNRIITFVYDASGAKLRKIVNNNGTTDTYDYVNGVEYKNTVLQRIAHTEGSVSVQVGGSFAHEYVLRDHLGNTRVTFTDINNDGIVATADIKQLNSYYPFGMNMDGNFNGTAGSNKYQYNGKEWNDDFSLGWNDYGARLYDPVLGRMLSPDNLVGDGGSQAFNRYSYANNNPLKFTDPNGNNPMLIGALIGAGIDLGIQLWKNGGDIHNVNWGSVVASGVAGAVGGGIGQWVGKGASAALKIANSTLHGAIVGTIGGTAGGFAGGFTAGFLNGQRNSELLKTAGWGALTGGITGGILGAWGGYKNGKVPTQRGTFPNREVSGSYDLEEGIAHFDDFLDESGKIIPAHDKIGNRAFTSAPKRHIALGVNQRIQLFSRALKAEDWHTWSPETDGNRDLFGSDFLRTINDPNTTIHFELTLPNGEMMNVNKAIQEVARAGGNINNVRVTSWELYQISNNPSAISRTLFYHGPNSIGSLFRK